ncbi:ferrichrome transport system permease FhuB,Iron-uptake system permease protein FeuB,iron-enterobactin transporter membrane protein,ABC-type Fe3+-siderophore transport system, permease component,proposed F420-0 ABC transporter, permease protein,FecCD transport family [[Clostridium] sordellii]|uniref:FecCD family ABC transporter permease n=1 Tax=Paraclostridium sordellii TaxID=1505 RepID=UPI000541F122|nr:iron ABC transporter permease [Paeniclostridium sordellii]CEK33296.1 ferrichrome transport system permease FhuB,Iron-uptake system permease protein FeuB,iron-enterobactin transporter membrane protein,ABC-type Fe3+-siderophore transport system, permease component,proposed F420-0 ABC transporter, permease protein,FecCD transport family [[Clostridium] sordellii] [Paeniclostridium sordellii]
MKKLSKKTLACIFMGLGIILLIFGIVMSISLGAKNIDISTIIQSLFIDNGDVNTKIIRDVRIPRAIAATLVGGFLAVAGAIMQGITRNPIAEPSVMGITQGATFMIAVAFVVQRINQNLVIGSFGLMIFAFLGASISGILVYFISSRASRKVDPVKLALAGTALGTLLISLAMGITMYFNLSQQLSFWISGGLVSAKWEGVKLLAIVGGSALIGAMIMAPKITILSLGEEVAIGLGQKTNVVRFISIIVVILLTGASVSVAGNIVFVGLIVPQIAKRVVGADYKFIIPSSMILGSVLLVYSDILARMINPPYETPIGSLTALLGVPMFIYLVRKDTK